MSVSGEMASGTLRFLERALDRERATARTGTLQQLGLTREQVQAAARATVPLLPDEVRRAAIRATPKMGYGQKGFPAAMVAQIYADYQRLGSCSKVAALYGRTRQTIWETLTAHGCELKAKVFNHKFHYQGTDYTHGKTRTGHRYWRACKGDRHLLHQRIWKEAGHEIPAGYELTFRDGNGLNWQLGNLELVVKGTTARRLQREKRRAA